MHYLPGTYKSLKKINLKTRIIIIHIVYEILQNIIFVVVCNPLTSTYTLPVLKQEKNVYCLLISHNVIFFSFTSFTYLTIVFRVERTNRLIPNTLYARCTQKRMYWNAKRNCDRSILKKKINMTSRMHFRCLGLLNWIF